MCKAKIYNKNTSTVTAISGKHKWILWRITILFPWKFLWFDKLTKNLEKIESIKFNTFFLHSEMDHYIIDESDKIIWNIEIETVLKKQIEKVLLPFVHKNIMNISIIANVLYCQQRNWSFDRNELHFSHKNNETVHTLDTIKKYDNFFLFNWKIKKNQI